jgi:hypothetical protein
MGSAKVSDVSQPKYEISTSGLVQVFLLDISEYVKNMGDCKH